MDKKASINIQQHFAMWMDNPFINFLTRRKKETHKLDEGVKHTPKLLSKNFLSKEIIILKCQETYGSSFLFK